MFVFTENVQKGPGSGRGDVAAAERGFALVVATVANRRQANDQSASEIPDPRVDRRSVFPPSDTHFDERSAGGRGREKKKWMKREKKRTSDGERVFKKKKYRFIFCFKVTQH